LWQSEEYHSALTIVEEYHSALTVVMMDNDVEKEIMGAFQDKPKIFLVMGSKSN